MNGSINSVERIARRTSGTTITFRCVLTDATSTVTVRGSCLRVGDVVEVNPDGTFTIRGKRSLDVEETANAPAA